MERRQVSRVLISVSDKSKLTDFATELESLGVEIVSTGGTSKAIKDKKARSGITWLLFDIAIKPLNPITNTIGNIIKKTKRIAIANKESIICGWELIEKKLKQFKMQMYLNVH